MSNNLEQPKRAQWSGNIGFILAAAGSAVGLGNLVKFPYLASKFGGGAFLIIYLIALVTIGFVIMLAELTLGRATRSNTYGAFKKVKPQFAWVGFICILTGFLILSYYSVIGGWTLKYIITYISGGIPGDAGTYFGTFSSSAVEPILYHGIFMVLTALIVIRGVSKGIEKASTIMMPGLVILLIIVAIRSMTLPGAVEGIKYFLIPDFSKITIEVVFAALGQVFYSLSIGMGIICTYGSYMSKKQSLEKNALIVPLCDTLIALIAGFAVLPAMFATGFEPTESTIGSIFMILPQVFDKMPAGTIFGALFFILVFFAAITSSISILEGTVAFVSEELKIKRSVAVVGLAALMFIIGSFASLSMGAVDLNFPQISQQGIQSLSFFDFLANTPDLILMPIGGLFIAIVVGWVWGTDNAVNEITQGGTVKFVLKRLWVISVKFITPAAILILFLSQLGAFNFLK